ncbi:ATP-binding protein [Spongiivirga citrea]|uniref:histidine kinase n=1 Tax=Spongiivirga citrea TaxID=1481457 RepID=A0A6M0CK90_9FLAO|nr:ATP-binding protein [Spongiivirga citrea]NER18032.1 response regulator [Spongiivirga citrea]
MPQTSDNFVKSNAQYIKVSGNGSIIDSDNTFINVSSKKNITDIHPFFESVAPFLADLQAEENMVCVNLDLEGKSGIFDILIKKIENTDEQVIVLQDFTDHYNEFQRVAQLRNESVINSEVIELRNKQLAAEKEFKNRFVANVSHEIRTPLNSILGFLTLLEKSHLNSEQQGLVGIVKKSSNHLNGLIEDLLDISKIEAGQLTTVKKKFKLDDVAKYLTKFFKAKAEEGEIDFNIELAPNVPETIIGDRTRLQQILINLLGNAFKFTSEGSVTLRISENSRRGKKVNLNFNVTDTGIGIAEENLEAIFESFTQVHNNPLYGGTGLGLSITKHIVDFLGGKISVKSELGNGTTFSLNLNYELELGRGDKSKKKEESAVFFKPDKKYQILMVEDSESNQMLLMKLLVSQGNFFVDLATNGQEALDFISTTDYDLVILDIKIPKVNGLEVAKQLRASEDIFIRRLPIIALTAYATADDRKACKQAGINDFLAIPFESNDLFEKMARLLK